MFYLLDAVFCTSAFIVMKGYSVKLAFLGRYCEVGRRKDSKQENLVLKVLFEFFVNIPNGFRTAKSLHPVVHLEKSGNWFPTIFF